MPKIHIQPVKASEIEVLKKVAQATFFDTYAFYNTPENMEQYRQAYFTTESIKMELAQADSSFYFARQNENIAGYLKLNRRSAAKLVGKGLEIERIYICKEAQGQGIGKKLYQYALAFAEKENASYIWLRVWSKNEKAIRFYEKLGFEIFDTAIFQLGDDLQDDFLMKKGLT